jgi:hypothetical protein
MNVSCAQPQWLTVMLCGLLLSACSCSWNVFRCFLPWDRCFTLSLSAVAGMLPKLASPLGLFLQLMKMIADRPDVLVLAVNFDENKTVVKAMGVKVCGGFMVA